jgi:hypothetical protein
MPEPFTQCPPPAGLDEPQPGNLACSLTLPTLAATPAIAHEVAETVLDIHGLGELIEPALLVVRELAAYACRFTAAGGEVYLNIRQRDDTLRLTVFDTHPRHTQPQLLARCDEQRRATLTLTPKVVNAHHGTWGFRAAQHPSAGTRTWATLVNAPRRWSA